MNWISILSGTDWEHAVGFSIASVTLISVVSVCAARLLPKYATIRDGVLRSALAACLIIPVVGFVIGVVRTPIFVVPFAANSNAALFSAKHVEAIDAYPIANTFEPTSEVDTATKYFDDAKKITASSNYQELPQHNTMISIETRLFSTPTLWRAILAVWLAGTAAPLIYALRSHRRGWSIRRQAKLIDSVQLTQCAMLAQHQVGLNRLPSIVESEAIFTPVVHGFFRPAIILPQNILESVTDAQLTDVLIHEFAHVYRRDTMIVIAETVASSMLWPIITVHWMIRELGRSREEVCDNFVLAHRESAAYAETLLKLAEFACGRIAAIPAVGILNWGGKFEKRVAGLLVENRSRSKKLSPFIFVPLTMSILLSGISLTGARLVAIETGEKTTEKSSQVIVIRVVDAKGEPLPDCHVSVACVTEKTDVTTTVNSDSDGKATLELVPASYRLTVEPPSKLEYVPIVDQIVVVNGKNQTIKKIITMPLGCVLHFKAIDSESKEPIPGIHFWTQIDGTVGRSGVQSSPMFVDYPITDKDGELRAIVSPGRRSFGIVFSSSEEQIASYQASLDLIEKVQLQLVLERTKKEARYHFLMNKLGLSEDGDSDELKNSFLLKQAGFDHERDERKKALSKVDERLAGIADLMKIEGAVRKEMLQSLTIEAERYLNTRYSHEEARSLLNIVTDNLKQIAKLKNAIEGVDIEISNLEPQKKSLKRTNGENHPSVIGLSIRIESYRSRKEVLEQELIKLQHNLAADPSDEKEDESKAVQNANSDFNESWIEVYVLTLRREKEQHEQAIQDLNEEIKNMAAQVSVIRSEIAELNMLINEIQENEKKASKLMGRLSEIAKESSTMNPADAYEGTPQFIDCESGKTFRVTFELRGKK